MPKIILKIETPREKRSVELGDELTIGRTSDADIALDDSGLSRKNTIFFRDGESVFALDENSTNGTFLNGEKLGNSPRQIYVGDTLKLGSETRITVESEELRFERKPDFAFLPETETAKDKGKQTKIKDQRSKAKS